MMTQNSMRLWRSREYGVSAIFIVLFSTMLFSLITVSFTALMVREQGRSFDDEQSRGAYDAALVGIEDGKRVLDTCLQGASTSTACTAIQAGQCNTIARAIDGASATTAERIVRTDTSMTANQSLNMAYTCVIINPSTPDYLAELPEHDSSVVVSLKPASTESFSKIRVSWFTEANSATVSGLSTTRELIALGDWASQKPPMLRAQLFQHRLNESVNIGTFDANDYAATQYLYPTTLTDSISFGDDVRRSGDIDLVSATCNTTFTLGYACTADIDVPPVPSGGALNQRVAYLRLTSIYKGANVRVQMLNASDVVVNFDKVQPSIDSTGRANDLFRRVESRVEFADDSFPFPRATVDITGNFCKVVSLTNNAAGYDSRLGICNPVSP